MNKDEFETIGKFTKVEERDGGLNVAEVVDLKKVRELTDVHCDVEFENDPDIIIDGMQKEIELLRQMVDCYRDGLDCLMSKVHGGGLKNDDELIHDISCIQEQIEEIEYSWQIDCDDY